MTFFYWNAEMFLNNPKCIASSSSCNQNICFLPFRSHEAQISEIPF